MNALCGRQRSLDEAGLLESWLSIDDDVGRTGVRCCERPQHPIISTSHEIYCFLPCGCRRNSFSAFFLPSGRSSAVVFGTGSWSRKAD
ncbi:MAG: hypothetical protein EBZ13_09795 [Planctomycetia bacterium]|nr:hypothetical protein [Planctomycetia bacterium]